MNRDCCKNITLIVPRNDLESQTIIGVAEKMGFSDIRVSPQGWGAQLEKEPEENVSHLKDEVWIVEIPGPAIETRLRYDGHRVCVIDHHLYQGYNRWNEKSSIEQFAEKCGYELNREEKWIAINDREYLWGLADANVPFDDIQRIRKMDYLAQGWKDEDFANNLSEFAGIQDRIHAHVIDNKPVFMYVTQLEKTGYLVEKFHMPDNIHYEMYRKSDMSHPYCRENLLLINKGPSSWAFFSGSVRYRNTLLWHCYRPELRYWMGGDGEHGYVGMSTIPQMHDFNNLTDSIWRRKI